MAELTVDGLLREAAARDPSRCAIRTEDSSITYGELDRAVDACAAALTGLGGGPGTTVGVVTALDPAFAVAFYGVIRGGGVVVTVNPLLGDEALAHVFAAARIGLAFVTPELDRRLRALRPPYLRELIVYGTALPPGPAPQDPDPDAVACIHFTSGTTGSPKAVPLTHRNLTANAAQVVGAHELAAGTVTLNHLPAY
ncbi:MAG: acyl--CoA ligase, partial [Nonomuraea sp.]|nr:acyl--CoA ligase [Nonomuraea sp.]